MQFVLAFCYFCVLHKYIDKKLSGKSKEEQMVEKKQELEKRLQDVTGQLGSAKKAAKKGKHCEMFINFIYFYDFLFTLTHYTRFQYYSLIQFCLCVCV